jgi:hypothetical protein
MTCTCHPESPFLWRKTPHPSVFSKDNTALLSRQATSYVESERAKNRDVGHIPGITEKQRFLQPRRFVIFSRA